MGKQKRRSFWGGRENCVLARSTSRKVHGLHDDSHNANNQLYVGAVYNNLKQVHHDSDDSHNANNQLYVGAVHNNLKQVHHDDFKVTCKINDTLVKFDIDTGAECNVIPKSVFQAVTKRKTPLNSASTVNSQQSEGQLGPIYGDN